jgi:hypothetical protein
VIEDNHRDLYKLNNTENANDDISARLRVSVHFVKDAIDLIDKHMPLRTQLRRH